jgi:cold shock CspA family protein
MKTTEKDFKIGRVKAFDHDRGFGFITCFDDFNQYFVHISKLQTGQIDMGDFVAFELAPSRKKQGTMEAIKVSLVSENANDPSFLISSYFRIDNDEFKKLVIKTLDTGSVLKLVEQELQAFKHIENEEQATDYMKAYLRIQNAVSLETLSKGVKDIFSAWAQKVSNKNAVMDLWLRGGLDVLPGPANIEEAFTNGDWILKRRIFSRCNDEHRKLLTVKLIELYSPLEVLNFLSRYVSEINSLDSFSFQKKLSDPVFWIDKPGQVFLELAFSKYKKELTQSEVLQLCLAGYPFEFPESFVLENTATLSIDTVEKIISSKTISDKGRTEFYRRLLEFVQNEEALETVHKYYKTVRQCSDDELSIFDHEAAQILPSELYFSLWQNGDGKILPKEALKHFFQSVPTIQVVETWIRLGRLKPQDVVSINADIISGLDAVRSRFQFYSFHSCLSYLRKFGMEEVEIAKSVHNSVKIFQEVSLWISTQENFSYGRYKPYFLFLSHEHQVCFLKSAFMLHHKGEMKINANELKSLLNVQPPELDKSEIAVNVTIDVLVSAIEQLQKNKQFLVDYDLIAIALKNLSNNKSYKLQLGDIFEKCAGRTEAEYNWRTSGEITKEFFGNGQFYFAITIPTRIQTWSRLGGERWTANPNFDKLLEAVKQIPGRKYNAQKEHWGVPASQEQEVKKFAIQHRLFFKLEGSNFANNPHLAEFKKVETPTGITYCEGRLSNQQHQTFNREFWWCCNQPCFQNCETIHTPHQWREYSFLDFLLILGYNLDDVNRLGDYIEKGKYYQFVSSINRFNRLLERMYCAECNNILQPVEDSHFAHHRVVRFCCANSTCSQHKIEVYLHHCMNGKCNGIIDSRLSKKCPNGLFICSNNKCGCCCSDDMFRRREANLRTTGGVIPEGLARMIQTSAGHLDKAERYCFRCGTKMDGNGDIFNCGNCNMRYDTTATKPLSKTRKRKTIVESDNEVDF